MRLYKLLDIDDGRLKRAEDIKVDLLQTHTVLSEPSNFLVRLIRRLLMRPKILTYVLVFECTNIKNYNKYKVAVELSPQVSFQKLLSTKVKYYCSCDDFLYRAAWVLNNDESLFINASNKDRLKPAITQKPQHMNRTTTMCKHVAAVFEYIRKNFKNLNLVLE